MTIEAASSLAPGTTVTAAVAIVGGGPAGITVALDLAAAGVDVVVLESGERDPTEEGRELDRGEIVGTPFLFGSTSMTTSDTRIRALGGASGHWAGLCRPLEEIDLRARPWLPGSGWPISRADLDPWYAEANDTLRLGTMGFDPAGWFQRTGAEQLILPGPLETIIVQGSPPVRFGSDAATRLEAADGPRVLLGATAVDATLDGRSDRLAGLTIVTSEGRTHDVVADTFVLAAGGYEVARLLLSWDGERGVANSSDRVGRGFADHPHRSAGQVRVLLDSDAPPLYSWGDTPGDEPPTRVWGGWAPTAETQEAEGISSSALFLRFAGEAAVDEAIPGPLDDAVGPLLSWSTGDPRARIARVDVRSEQGFDPNSRITLGKERDASGLRRVRIDWRTSELDDRTGRRTVELFAAELARAGRGRVQIEPGGRPYEDLPFEIGCHPMGTARMSDDPAAGVVDADLRTHDVENLYVCSSAVFPTGGHANPTMTIVALAHRLAAHLGGT